MSETKIQNTGFPPVLGITFGDVNGIGPEIIIRILEDSRILKHCTLVLYGHHKIINQYRKLFAAEEFQIIPCKTAGQAAPRKINMINCWDQDYEIKPGQSDPAAGMFAFQALQKATEDLKSGQIQGLITAPITKANMPEQEFPFPGHTEFFAKAAGVGESLMFMVHEDLKIALSTAHLPLERVSGILTRNLIFNKLNQLEKSLIKDFDIPKPKIAVLGFNPHAGENGKLGKEEDAVIGPVVREWRDKGKFVYGPFPSDGFFASGQYKKFDAILAMYHDQGLIPFKIIAGMEGVNFSAGLPFIRVSPDHGTAYDIAGKGIASAESIRAAIFFALDLIQIKEEKVVKVI